MGLPLLIAPVVLSFFAYRGWLQNKREEEQRREGDRMRTLYEAGRALDGPLDANFDFQPFLGFVQQLVDAAGTELAVRDEAGLRVYDSESGLYQAVQTEMGPADPATYVSARPGLATYVAAVRDEANEVGILAVHRATQLSPSECALVDSLASQVSARHRNQQLFDETVEQRGHLADVVGSSSDGIFVVSGGARCSPGTRRWRGSPATSRTRWWVVVPVTFSGSPASREWMDRPRRSSRSGSRSPRTR